MPSALRQAAGLFLLATGGLVALWFVANPFFVGPQSFVTAVWQYFNGLIAIGLIISLVFNFSRKRNRDRVAPNNASVDWQRVVFNVLLFLNLFLGLLFFNRWITDDLTRFWGSGDNFKAVGEFSLVWMLLYAALPILFSTTGLAMLRRR